MTEVTHILFETASGLSLYKRIGGDDLIGNMESLQSAATDLGKFGKSIELVSFLPFKNAADALLAANELSEGLVTKSLKDFLEMNLPKTKKDTKKGSKASGKIVLGVQDKNLASALKADLSIDCDSSERVQELCRGIRLFSDKLISNLREGDSEKAQLSLSHAYSRCKVKFNIHRSDNMIIQSIALLDQLDKDINTFGMRVREWYSWHFPELFKISPENATFCKLVNIIGDKNNLTEEAIPKLAEALANDEIKAKNIIDASRSSMGTDISEMDLMNIQRFATKVCDLFIFRTKLSNYLSDKMGIVAPNLAALIGDTVGARLISHAGSLTNLSKVPASTLQILGAEKALFRALKSKTNTPKYGLIFHSGFVGKSNSKNKGRISRYLANKASIAARIDCFSDTPTSKFGQAMHNQVDERIKFYEESGKPPKKNIDVMKSVLDEIQPAVLVDGDSVQKSTDKKRKKTEVIAETPSKKKSKNEDETPSKKKSKSEVETPSKKKNIVPSESPKKTPKSDKKKKSKD